jgi:hypothetical protein
MKRPVLPGLADGPRGARSARWEGIAGARKGGRRLIPAVGTDLHEAMDRSLLNARVIRGHVAEREEATVSEAVIMLNDLVILAVVTVPPCGPNLPLAVYAVGERTAGGSEGNGRDETRADTGECLDLVMLDLLSEAKYRALCDTSGDYRPCPSLVVGKITRVVD